jgi:hypothetical protein
MVSAFGTDGAIISATENYSAFGIFKLKKLNQFKKVSGFERARRVALVA